MAVIKFTIDGKELEVEEGTTVLEAARKFEIYIPSICYDPDLSSYNGCKLCVVEVEGEDYETEDLPTSCTTLATEGMVVRTNTERVITARKRVLEIIKMDHANDCKLCPKNEHCELQEVSNYIGVETHQSTKTAYPSAPDRSAVFFNLDRSRCVLCTRCVRTCKELQGLGALELVGQGFNTNIAGAGYLPIGESACESCGQCIEHCPTAALLPKVYQVPTNEIETICTYCGVGCSMYIGIYYDRLVNVRGNRASPVNQGALCVKGRFGIVEFVNSFDRLDAPMLKKNGELSRASWDEAFEFIAEKLSKYKGTNEFAFIASAKCTNEENYLMQKFTRAVMGTNNIDHCARLCHAPTVTGLKECFGSGAMTNSIADLKSSKCVLVLGSNTTEAHPVIGIQLRKMAQGGTAKILVANPRRIDLCNDAELWLQHRPGTDVALLNGIAKVILDAKLSAQDFIEARCENFEDYKNSLADYTLEKVEKITGVPGEMIEHAARLYAENSPAAILFAMGITQHSHGTDNVKAVANLAMLTGNIGLEGAGVNPLRGHNNVQGACDMGALPDVMTGYQSVSDEAARKSFEGLWNCELPAEPGLTLTEIFDAIDEGKIKALYIVGENPVLSDPDAKHIQEALKKLEFLVVQDLFITETAKFADVILPGTSFAEKDGTFTNTERRVQRVRKVIEPIGNSKPDWQIISELGDKLGSQGGFEYGNPAEIMDELAKLTPIYGGISYSRLDAGGGLQWPCPDPTHPGTPILHCEQFACESTKGKFSPVEYKPPQELPDEEYPLILTTGRSLYHFHTGTLSRKVGGLNQLKSTEEVEINPKDAEVFGVMEGAPLKVSSRRGSVVARAKITESSPPGVIFMTFHFAESPTNQLTSTALDPVSKIPELKVCAVKIEKISEEELPEAVAVPAASEGAAAGGDDLDDLFD